MRKKQANKEVIVSSSGFSDKRIKLESLNNLPPVSVDSVVVEDWLSNQFIDDLIKDIDIQDYKDIGINRKPRLRYKDYKEPPGKGRYMSRAEINEMQLEKVIKEALKAKQPKVYIILALLLTGKPYSYKEIEQQINDIVGKKLISVKGCHPIFHNIKRSAISFLLEQAGNNPKSWRLNPKALEISIDDLYQLYNSVRSFNMEQACKKYPVLIGLLRDKKGIDILATSSDYGTELTSSTTEAEEVDNLRVERSTLTMPEASAEKPPTGIQPTPMSEESVEKLPTGIQPLLKLLEQINGGGFDLNVNFNIRIMFGDK